MKLPEIDFNYQKAGNIGIELIRLEDLYNRTLLLDLAPLKPHRLNFYNLIFIEQGSGKHLIDFDEYDFAAGSFILVHPDQVQAFDLTADTKGKVLLFTESFVDQVLNNMRVPRFTANHLGVNYQPVFQPVDDGLPSSVLLMGELFKELVNPERNELILMHLFSCLLLTLRRAQYEVSQSELSTSQTDKLTRFLALLHNDFTTIRDAKLYADKLHITYKTLNLVCKRGLGQTAKELIDAHTVLEAKRRLVIDNCSTQQLAGDLGFNDASNFVKYFKKHTGYTPSSFCKLYGYSRD
jgi:AraC-like DNA-binding protein